MNKRGQAFLLAFMLGFTVIILALALAPGLKEQTEESMNTQNLNCADAGQNLTTFDKSACIVTDLNLFYFIGGLIFIAGAVITAKLVIR